MPGRTRARDVLHLRTAGILERRRRVRERDVAAVGVGGGTIDGQAAVESARAVELDAAHAHLLGVGEIAAQHPDAGVDDLRLEILDPGVVDA